MNLKIMAITERKCQTINTASKVDDKSIKQTESKFVFAIPCGELWVLINLLKNQQLHYNFAIVLQYDELINQP